METTTHSNTTATRTAVGERNIRQIERGSDRIGFELEPTSPLDGSSSHVGNAVNDTLLERLEI